MYITYTNLYNIAEVRKIEYVNKYLPKKEMGFEFQAPNGLAGGVHIYKPNKCNYLSICIITNSKINCSCTTYAHHCNTPTLTYTVMLIYKVIIRYTVYVETFARLNFREFRE